MSSRPADAAIPTLRPLAQGVSLADLGLTPSLLRFSGPVSARYEAETGAARALHLRRTILIGLLFYNAYEVVDFFLMPDVITLGVVLRLLVVTPLALCLAWVAPSLRKTVRESLTTLGLLMAAAVPILLFALSRHPLSAYGCFEFPLIMVFGGMLLVLRVPHTLIVTGGTVALSLLALAYRTDLGPELALPIALQILTAGFFVLYGNHQIEAVRRRAYLVSLREILRSAGLEEDRRTLTALSETDPLTGLANRRALDAALSACTGPRPLRTALFMIDVDHFKRYNDAYGHPAGDDCLRRVAQALAEETRGRDDLVARYGGEEFCVLMRGCDDSEVERVAWRLCDRIARLGMPHRDRGDGLKVVTASVGVAVLAPHRAIAPDEFVAVADVALYEAKRLGRNGHVVRRIDETIQVARARRSLRGLEGPMRRLEARAETIAAVAR